MVSDGFNHIPKLRFSPLSSDTKPPLFNKISTPSWSILSALNHVPSEKLVRRNDSSSISSFSVPSNVLNG
jgi:hypothetical protein